MREVRVAAVERGTDRAVIEGYGAVFNERDLNGDVIRPGAFSKKLIPSHSNEVRMLYQHTVSEPIGRWLMMREDERGLFVRGEILLGTRRGRDVWELVQARALDGLSIGFQTGRARKLKGGRELLEIDLWEISIVTFPMALMARITGAKFIPAEGKATAARRKEDLTLVANRLREAARL